MLIKTLRNLYGWQKILLERKIYLNTREATGILQPQVISCKHRQILRMSTNDDSKNNTKKKLGWAVFLSILS